MNLLKLRWSCRWKILLFNSDIRDQSVVTSGENHSLASLVTGELRGAVGLFQVLDATFFSSGRSRWSRPLVEKRGRKKPSTRVARDRENYAAP
jgi:hypothetical protein